MGARTGVKENSIESYLRREVIKAGGVVRKLQWINHRNAPDRIVFLNGVWFVELKRPGGKPRPPQLREHARLRGHGAKVFVIDTKEQVNEFIKDICR